MKQVIPAGWANTLGTTATSYEGIGGGGYAWTLTEADTQQVVSPPGKISNLIVRLSGSPGTGKSYTFTLRVNGADSALTCTIADAATSAEDTTHEVDVVAGDLLSISCVPSGTPSPRTAKWTVVFAGTNDKESPILGLTEANAYFTIYGAISSSCPYSDLTESKSYEICPTPGKVKDFYVDLEASPGTAPDAYRFTLRKNGVSQSLMVTITAPNTTGNDTANEVNVAAGDRLDLLIEPLNTPSATVKTRFGMTFVADIDGESLLLGTSPDEPSTTATEYNQLHKGSWCESWLASESPCSQLGQACTLKKLYVLLDDAPGDGKSYAFTVRKNGEDTSLTLTISGVATTGNDTVHEVSVADGDEVGLKCTPSETPAVTYVHWGLVSYEVMPQEITNAGNIATAEAIYTAIVAGPVTQAVSIATAEEFYAPSVTFAPIGAPFIASVEAVYAPQVSTELEIIAAYISSEEAVYAPVVGGAVIQESRIASAEEFYAPVVTCYRSITAAFIPSAEEVYAPTVWLGAVQVIDDAGGIASAEEFYTPVVAGPITQVARIASAEAVYVPVVEVGIWVLAPFIASAEEHYAPTLIMHVFVFPARIESIEAVYVPLVSLGAYVREAIRNLPPVRVLHSVREIGKER